MMEVTALVLGFMGSLHCIGMCSPLAMVATRVSGGFLRNRLLYNSGRIFTYGIFGALVSGVGALLVFPQVQNLFSITVGLVLVIAGVAGTAAIRIPLITTGLAKFTVWLKQQFSDFLGRRGWMALFVTGVFNGMLPCGLVYLALGYCLTLSGWQDGLLFMLLFGAGTLPAMLGLPALMSFLRVRLHVNVRNMVTVLFVVSGSLLILRGIVNQPGTSPEAHDTAIPFCR